jgi:hypothetical protein
MLICPICQTLLEVTDGKDFTICPLCGKIQFIPIKNETYNRKDESADGASE